MSVEVDGEEGQKRMEPDDAIGCSSGRILLCCSKMSSSHEPCNVGTLEQSFG